MQSQTNDDFEGTKKISQMSGGHRQTAECALALHRAGKDVTIKVSSTNSYTLSDIHDYWLKSKDGKTLIMYESRGKGMVDATLVDSTEIIVSG